MYKRAPLQKPHNVVKMPREKWADAAKEWMRPVSRMREGSAGGSLNMQMPVSAPAPAPVTAAATASAPAPYGAPAAFGAAPQNGGAFDPISYTIMALNSNPYLIGILMLLLNLGGRFLSLELTKKQEAFLQTPWIRPLIFFTVIFVATRNLVAAFWVTLLFFFIIWVVANEHSSFCMIPSWCGHNIEEQNTLYQKNVNTLQAVRH